LIPIFELFQDGVIVIPANHDKNLKAEPSYFSPSLARRLSIPSNDEGRIEIDSTSVIDFVDLENGE